MLEKYNPSLFQSARAIQGLGVSYRRRTLKLVKFTSTSGKSSGEDGMEAGVWWLWPSNIPTDE